MRLPWNRNEADLDREIRHHLHELAAEYQRQGYTSAEARRMARRQFGGPEQIKEECRDESRWAFWTGFRQDVAFGLRMMRKAPVVTAAAVLSLALGIGATTAIGSLMSTVLWRHLPLPDPQQITVVNWRGQGFPRDLADAGSGSMYPLGGAAVADFFPYSAFTAMRKAVAPQGTLAAHTYANRVSVSFAGNASVAWERPVSGNFFAMLQARPAQGRLFSDSDDSSAANAVVVVSHRFWRASLNADPNVVGQVVRINDRPRAIAGVLNESFYGLVPGDPTDIYTPVHHSAHMMESFRGTSPLSSDRFWCISLLLRRNPGVMEAHVKDVLQGAFRSTWTRVPGDMAKAPEVYLEDGSGGLGSLRREFRSPLWILGALIGLLLMIACTNIANLLLARASGRAKEIAMRVSMGCSRARLMRQFLTESALLAALGGSGAVVVGFATANLLGEFLSGSENGTAVAVDMDARLFLIAGLVTVLALFLFGLFPAWQGSRLSVVDATKEGGGSIGSTSRRGLSNARLLVLAQMAMSVVLVMAAVLFVRNLIGARSVDPGFERRNLVLFNVRPGVSGYEKSRLPQFYSNLERRMAEVPGVATAGLSGMRPMDGGGWWEDVNLPGETKKQIVSVNGVTPGYLSLVAPRLIAGRFITTSDIQAKAKVAVISEDLAQHFGGAAALGNTLEFQGPPNAPGDRFEIAGVIPAIASNSIKDRRPTVWLPLDAQSAEVTVMLRTQGPPEAVLPAIQQAMREIDRNLPMVDVITMEGQIAKVLQNERMFATLCGGLGILALVLSVVGLYGVTWYGASRRRPEIGVRLALGAVPRDVLLMVLREGVLLAGAGMALGIPAIWFASRFLEKELYNLKPLDPYSLTVAAVILFAAAFVAVAIPAYRASALHPLDALRHD